ncbi:hypothetical protein GBAR_LOCUS100 [Geodia barretti]|uniref:Uncharacterized protein n=1 Tax=Geodia barretti TaxID=519541 RepID=A0AA35QS48_GEOBA|nr:hypothetical protein GBAR_LOCUS100 [Geodia barretti]
MAGICRGFGGFNNGDNYYNEIRRDHRYKLEDGVKLNLGFSESANETIEKNFPAQRADADYFAFWCYTISCPVALVTLVLHLFLHNLYIFGVIGHILLGLCLVSGGGVFWGDARLLFSEDDNLQEQYSFPENWRSDTYYGLWLVVEWVGVFACMLALMFYAALLPFYTSSCKKGRQNEEGREIKEI